MRVWAFCKRAGETCLAGLCARVPGVVGGVRSVALDALCENLAKHCSLPAVAAWLLPPFLSFCWRFSLIKNASNKTQSGASLTTRLFGRNCFQAEGGAAAKDSFCASGMVGCRPGRWEGSPAAQRVFSRERLDHVKQTWQLARGRRERDSIHSSAFGKNSRRSFRASTSWPSSSASW